LLQQAERDAPIGDAALGSAFGTLLEYLLRLAVPERMLVAHAAIEPRCAVSLHEIAKWNGAETLVAPSWAGGGQTAAKRQPQRAARAVLAMT
jgi:hypothetical protein